MTTWSSVRERWPPAVFDRTLTAVLVIVAIAESLATGAGGPGVPALWTAALGALPCIPVLLRRRHPVIGLVLSETLFVLPHAFGSFQTLFIGGFLVLVLQLASCAEHARRPWDVLSTLTLAPLLVSMMVLDPSAGPFEGYVFDLLVFGAGWAFGHLLRQLRSQNEALLAALVDAREADALRTAAAIATERAYLARELHDVVAHCVSVMVLQAASARIQFERDPAASRQSMEQIERTGREALVELRRVLGVLRAEAGSDDDERGMADLPELTAQLCDSGLDVRTTVEGNAVPLSPALGRTAFRIVQEGLTNAVKHGTEGPVTLTVCYHPDRLDLIVDNPTAATARPTASTSAHGFGLLGMRERVAAFGGTLSADQENGIFRLHAELPLERPAR